MATGMRAYRRISSRFKRRARLAGFADEEPADSFFASAAVVPHRSTTCQAGNSRHCAGVDSVRFFISVFYFVLIQVEFSAWGAVSGKSRVLSKQDYSIFLCAMIFASLFSCGISRLQ
ncbi:hypothetical protein KDX27_19065 [Burkholderia cenocepacia]|jgi:hypothetical protein|uniref:hypothetical protein n=1 Tax=Burkholderia cenocepacia TaxID=95486 RepID=UPI001B9F075D|nr:hypothetical protein [Burkholderia cenocepacia]MBR8024535.1 hypothetical protein [Burkholderia cenocepacia]MBR8169826.1 hypothetical protein [Burkholderia cenocepacia]MBR8427049.1 hypothetical protein [Burkholderia cenocepacia]MBU9658699.1 hypothetical protein [Burkholderia cenocepacia]MCW5145086.1 hypothetical protein [Burkholderia cenocepacia]